MSGLEVRSSGGTQDYGSIQSGSKDIDGRQVKPWIELTGGVGMIAVGVTLLVLAFMLGQWGIPKKELWKWVGSCLGVVVLVAGGVSGSILGAAYAGCAIQDLWKDHPIASRLAQAKDNVNTYFLAL